MNYLSAEDQAFTTAFVSSAAGSGSCLMHERVVTAPRTIFPFQGRIPVLLLQVFGPVLPEEKCCVPGFSVAWTKTQSGRHLPLFFFSTSEGTLPCLLCWHKVWTPLDQPLLRETLGLRESGVSYRPGIPWFRVWWGLVGRVSQSRLSAALLVTAADVGEGPGKQCWPIPMV